MFFEIWKITCCLLIVFNCVCCTVIETPQNALVFVGQSMSFKCRTTHGSIVREWSFSNRSSESNGLKIFSNWLTPQKLKSDRYNVDVGEFGSGVLYANSTQLEDAGTYNCLVDIGSRIDHYSAELIVLSSDPKCGIHGDNIVTGAMEGSGADIWCNVSYAGNLIPVARWFRNSRKIVLPTESENQLNRRNWFYFNTTFLLNSSDNGMVFSCEIHFQSTNTSDKKIDKNEATNVPNYVYKWNFTANVLYEPRDIRIEPQKTIYAFGDRLRCSADGNPSPNYTWSSVLWTHMDHREGSVLVIDENAFNESQFYSYRCTAFNSIFAANISVGVNFTIGQNKEWISAFPTLMFVSLPLLIVVVVILSVVTVVIGRRYSTLKCFYCMADSQADILQQMDSIRTEHERQPDDSFDQGQQPVYAQVNERVAGKDLKLRGKDRNREGSDAEKTDMANATSASSSNALEAEALAAAAVPADSGDKTLSAIEFPNTEVYSNFVGIRSPPTPSIYTGLKNFAPSTDDSGSFRKSWFDSNNDYVNV